MRNINIQSTPLVPSRMATPPPVEHRATRSGGPILPRVLARHAITFIAIALAFIVVALLDGALRLSGPDAQPLWVVAFAGIGAAAVGMTLRRSDTRRRIPSAPRAAAAPAGRAADAPMGLNQLAAARVHERLAVSAWQRSLIGVLGALGVASLMLALVLRSPYSVPLLVGVGLTGILALRLLGGPRRGAAHPAAVVTSRSAPSTTAGTSSGTHARWRVGPFTPPAANDPHAPAPPSRYQQRGQLLTETILAA